jgi:hypothetical protein
MIPLHERGWMAGVLDMKGKVIAKQNQQRATPQLVLSVETSHHEIVRTLGRMTGTAPEIQKPKKMEEWMRRGCVEHCPEQHHHVKYAQGMPAISRWTVTGISLAIVLHNVLPFIVTKNNVFTEAMNNAFTDVPPSGQGRAAVDRAIVRLKDLGWDIPDLAYPPEREPLRLVKHHAAS